MTEVTPVMVLDRMLVILAKPEAWTKERVAKDASGLPCPSDGKAAVCFCVYGALSRSLAELRAPEHIFMEVVESLRDESGRQFQTTPSFYNDLDSTTHADILDYLKAVRARLEAA